MGIAYPRNIGFHIKSVVGIAPQAGTAATANGTGFDRRGYASCSLAINKGATTGAPSAQTLDVKVQHSSDNSTWADYTDPSTQAVAKITQDTTATAAMIELDVDLSGANQYIRVVGTVGAFTGGTSPATPYGVSVVLGGAENEPA